MQKKLDLLKTLGIGVLGCALWAYGIDPLCRKFFTFVSAMLNIFFTGFMDQTYKQVSYGINDSNTIAIIELCFAILYFPILTLEITPYLKTFAVKKAERIKQSNAPAENATKFKKRLNKLTLILNSFIIISVIYLIGSLSFINHCQTITLCNIEIVSPYISDHEYKELKSSFHSISTKNDYDDLQSVIDNIATVNGLMLKK